MFEASDPEYTKGFQRQRFAVVASFKKFDALMSFSLEVVENECTNALLLCVFDYSNMKSRPFYISFILHCRA